MIKKQKDWIYIISLGAILLSAFLAIIFVNSDMKKIQPDKKDSVIKTFGEAFPYNLKKPSLVLNLQDELREISGISVGASSTDAWVINDEQGRIFQINLSSGEIIQSLKFGKKGDYEGIEVLEDSIVIARSDGELFRFSDGITTRVKSPLNSKFDVEGLAYDRKGARLLIACKGEAQAYKNKKVVFAVNLPSFEWEKEPVFVVSLEKLSEFIVNSKIKGIEEKQIRNFAPSGIAVDPKTNNVYLISSRGEMIVVLDPSGDIVAASSLDRAEHTQPEGISFSVDGSLYLTNEGRRSIPKLYNFDRILESR